MNNLRYIKDNLTSNTALKGSRVRGVRQIVGSAGLAAAATAMILGQAAGATVTANPRSFDANDRTPALEARQDGTGDGAYAHVENAASAGRALFGRTVGNGIAVVASVANSKSAATASKGVTVGSGAGVEGSSRLGTGGVFTGKTAQIQLVPSLGAAHPVMGVAGQLFVDRQNHLWFSRGGSDWQQLA
jgi:hypothetical protein